MTDEYGFHLEVRPPDPDDPRLDGPFAECAEDEGIGVIVIAIGAQYLEVSVENRPDGLSLHEPAVLAAELLRGNHLSEGEVLHLCWDLMPRMQARPGFCAPTVPRRTA